MSLFRASNPGVYFEKITFQFCSFFFIVLNFDEIFIRRKTVWRRDQVIRMYSNGLSTVAIASSLFN